MRSLLRMGNYAFFPITNTLQRLENEIEKSLLLQGQTQAKLVLNNQRIYPSLKDAEFRVFSQWGEDGIIQYLTSRVVIDRKVFVEFGVQDYCESNTRFLLLNNNWSGMVIDGNAENIRLIQSADWSWRHELNSKAAFVTRENINDLIGGGGIRGDIGLLSIDIDGNDYWVWEAITVVNPRIVVIEYNGLWGAVSSVSTPYDPQFVRGRAHYSNLYYGASLPALFGLAKKKGYTFVGSNSAGVNAFFVRSDVLGDLREAKIEDEYAPRKLRESRDKTGRLTFLNFEEQLNLLASLPLLDVNSGALIKVADLIASHRAV